MENEFISNNQVVSGDYHAGPKFLLKRIIFLLFGLVTFLVLFYVLFFSAPNNFPKGIVISIGKGENLRNLSLDLKQKKVIRSRISFEAFVILLGGERHIAEGDYLLENKLPVFEMARRIVNKDRHLASIKVTIPEGFDNIQIADTFAISLKNFNKDKFLGKAKIGYLFPDTYFFFSTDDERDVLEYMNQNFNKKLKPYISEIVSSGKSENEIIAMASLIEKEAKGNADRENISGILWNRLAKKMPLQVDSAPETYKARGLPENPISNPGLSSIIAAIHPSISNYLYYLHDKNGLIHYAKTFEEHKINKAKYLK